MEAIDLARWTQKVAEKREASWIPPSETSGVGRYSFKY